MIPARQHMLATVSLTVADYLTTATAESWPQWARPGRQPASSVG